MAKVKEKPQTAAEEADGMPPKDEREFTTREKGGHVTYLQRLETENVQQGNKVIAKPTKRAITVRLQFGVAFDPWKECGPDGKNARFRDIAPETAYAALLEKEKVRESPVIFFKDRPMDETEKEHDRALRAERKRADEQADENAKLRAFIEGKGLNVPADL